MAESDTTRTEDRGGPRWLRSLFGSREASLKEALEEVLQEHEEDGEALSNEERSMLRNVLEVGHLTVRDVMVPRADIVAVEHQASLVALKTAFVENGHTRMPVYEQTLDKLKGFIHLKDIVPALAGDESFEMTRVVRKIVYVSPTMKVIDLLAQMRVTGDHIAIVVDEYGGTDGLVTLEDLFEEIVGEIQDEHDTVEDGEEIRHLGENIYETDGRIRIEALEGALRVALREADEEEDYDTLGGLIFNRLGRVPVRGEIVHLGHARLDILDSDPRRVRRVRITLLPGETGVEPLPATG